MGPTYLLLVFGRIDFCEGKDAEAWVSARTIIWRSLGFCSARWADQGKAWHAGTPQSGASRSSTQMQPWQLEHLARQRCGHRRDGWKSAFRIVLVVHCGILRCPAAASLVRGNDLDCDLLSCCCGRQCRPPIGARRNTRLEHFVQSQASFRQRRPLVQVSDGHSASMALPFTMKRS